MANSALELYQQAYNLHYKERDLSAAIDIYNVLIKKFPDSNVSAYAAIQLQKINANEVSRSLFKMRSRMNATSQILFFILFLCVIVMATAGYVLYTRLQMQAKSLEALDLVLVHIIKGEEAAARDILNRIEIIYPSRPVVQSLLEIVAEKKATRPAAAPPKPVVQNPTDPDHAAAAVPSRRQAPADTTVRRLRAPVTDDSGAMPVAPPPAPPRKKPKLLVNPDSVSFF